MDLHKKYLVFALLIEPNSSIREEIPIEGNGNAKY